MHNSQDWINLITRKLFDAETRRLNNKIEELNRRNSEIKKKSFFGFIHLGQHYVPESCKVQAQVMRRQLAPTLAFELSNEANSFLSDVRKVELDKEQIQQTLFKLLYPAESLQDIRDSLPECLVPLAPEVVSCLSRQRSEPTWAIRNDERAVKQYMKILPKIEMYAMSRLLY